MLTFPTGVVLRGAMRPGLCGYHGDPLNPCTCALSTVTKDQKRFSGSLQDRVDIRVKVPRLNYQKLSDDRFREAS
ncbi:MAG TPA: ATP-binding protein [Anaerolineales bacterium]